MTRCAVHLLSVTVLSGLVLFGVGCSSTPPAGTGPPERRIQAATPVRDRELELTTLRAEMAATRIAAAKKEAELLELRDMVQQLRLENAEARQAFLELQGQAEQQKRDLEQAREAHTRQAQGNAAHDLNVLKETVVTLAQELGQLRQDLVKPVAKERMNSLNPSSSKSPNSGRQGPRPDPPQRVAEAHASPASAMSPIALTMTAAVPDPSSTITVQSGDTLASLAKRHRTTVEALRKRNGLNGDVLIVGRELILPTSPQP